MVGVNRAVGLHPDAGLLMLRKVVHISAPFTKRSPLRFLSCYAAAILWLVSHAATARSAQEEDEWQTGIVVEYQIGDESFRRIENDLGFDVSLGLPIDREAPDTITLVARGWWIPLGRDDYFWHLTGTGRFQLRIGDWESQEVELREGETQTLGPIPGSTDWQQFELHAVLPANSGRLNVSWTAPPFAAEPLPQHRLARLKDQEAEQFTRGQRWFHELRCAKCHVSKSPVVEPPAAPRLASRVAHTSIERLKAQLSPSNQGEVSNSHRMMPEFELTSTEVDDLLAHLASQAQTLALNPPAAGSRENGRLLLGSLGCVACHVSTDAANADEPTTAPGLEGLGHGRSPEFLAAWLRDPSSLDPNAQMPKVELSDAEIADLVACLLPSDLESTTRLEQLTFLPEQAERGRELFVSLRCGNCHEDQTPELTWTGAPSSPLCCEPTTESNRSRPSYSLSTDMLESLESYTRTLQSISSVDGSLTTTYRRASPPEILSSSGCMNCHERNSHKSSLRALAQNSGLLPQDFEGGHLSAPPLTGIGDKLRSEVLLSVLESGSRRRSWLTTRMPIYPELRHSAQGVIHWLQQVDRLPQSQIPAPFEVSEAEALVHGGRLLTSSGFGCTSCHAMGNHQPQGTLPHAQGPDLSGMSQRLERHWFDRWVRDPARMVPNMEMPSIRIPVHGVLDDDLDRQLAAIWKVADVEGFTPPRAEPERIAAQISFDKSNEPIWIRDTVRTANRRWISPLIIGLSQRQNGMWDDQSGALGAWWLGDVARQYTEGKTWYWAPGGTLIFERDAEDTEWSLESGSRWINSEARHQFRSDAADWSNEGHRFHSSHSLYFESTEASLTQEWSSLLERDEMQRGIASGIRREVALSGLPASSRMMWKGIPSSQSIHLTDANLDHARIESSIPWELRIESTSEHAFQDGHWIFRADESGQIRFTATYLTQLIPDVGVPIAEVDDAPASATNESDRAIPGFHGERLAESIDWMPTGLGWLNQDELFVTSLDGRVWNVSDFTSKTHEHEAKLFAQSLAAPFGVNTGVDTHGQSYVDVIHKFGLLRLRDRDGNGTADHVNRIAWGWGYTDDYHDWAVGLPRDSQGAYWIGISCQQDNRSMPASHLRGTVVRLVPQNDSRESYAVELISEGHRFPVGIAQSRSGEFFVTDNQGNFNPFNELNWVRQGKRYGFLNAWERAAGKAPNETPPTIAIPHPWTRSVNGICFLDPNGDDAVTDFGPFNGHLVGCEYDTRRLVRMSLERIDETVQGAVYPFSGESDDAYGFLQGPLTCAVAPSGELVVGTIRDSGWGGANNIGQLLRFRFDSQTLPAGIAEVRVKPDGFQIVFTREVDRDLANQNESYQIASYRRVSTPEYGGPDIDRREETLSRVVLSEDAKSVMIRLTEPLRAGFVYEFELESLVSDAEFFPAQAFYTLHQIPSE